MSEILTLAADFIERMANPGYGIRVNEDYALRFGSLLAGESLDKLLQSEISRIREPDALSPHGWLWLLNWARAKEIRLDEKLLLHLVETSSDVFMQVVIIDIATRHVEWERRERVAPLEEFDNFWLSQLLRRCTYFNRGEDLKDGNIDTIRSESILVALMQVGSEIALDAASTLLHHQWMGQRRLVEYFLSLCAEMEPQTRSNWLARLQPPE